MNNIILKYLLIKGQQRNRRVEIVINANEADNEDE